MPQKLFIGVKSDFKKEFMEVFGGHIMHLKAQIIHPIHVVVHYCNVPCRYHYRSTVLWKLSSRLCV
jgi:hypothetical protein